MAENSIASSIDRRSAALANSIASSIDARIADIENRRRRAGMSHIDLIRTARIDAATWWTLRNGGKPRAGTVERLRAALDGRSPPERKSPSSICSLYLAALRLFALKRGTDEGRAIAIARDFSSEKPRDPIWLACAAIRRLAMYTVTVELEVSNADLARAIGCSRQNVHQARRAIEDLREADPAIEALIVDIAGGLAP